METETAIASPLAKFKKNGQKKGFAGSIPTLVESVVYEDPINEIEGEESDRDENDNDDSEKNSTIKSQNQNSANSGRRGSLGFLPKGRRGSLGLSSLLGLKSGRPDASPGRDGVYTKNDDLLSTTPPPAPRRSSIAVPLELKNRRKSWASRLQPGKKRRNTSGGDEIELDEDVFASDKRRSSWWNVLVPENVLKNRSRRASQQLSRSDESITQLPYRRSKSRSVDHGVAPPFDLDSLRSKVEGRFDSVHKEEEEVLKRIPAPPIKTTTYVVRDRDTLTSVAARFDTTPSELTKMNRLATTFIFPGQNLIVPDKSEDSTKEGDTPSISGEGASDTSSQQNVPSEEKDFLDTLRPVSPEQKTSSTGPQRFLKINVRHITDGQGVVSGVLLVTPNAVMFDPNVSDALVLEHGPESYGVIAPMEFVVNAAIYYDIAHMRTQDANPNLTKGEKPEIYYIKSPSLDKDSLVKDETFPELITTVAEGDSSECGTDGETNNQTNDNTEPAERGGDAFPKAFDRDLVTPTNTQQLTEERRKSLLDHHWAIPSKERMSIDLTKEVIAQVSQEDDEEKHLEQLEQLEKLQQLQRELEQQARRGERGADLPALHLVKLSCHDSGIDIRDPLPIIQPNNTKKVYSDADIVLSQDWVPPVALASTVEPPLSAPPAPSEERIRKQVGVSFSADTQSAPTSAKLEDKGDKKNKMLKRLSYPLSWMEGLAGEAGGSSSSGSQAESVPTSADSHNSGSVFSKVFNSSPMNLVELGTGLFLNKTPSEEGPHDSIFPQSGRSSYGGFGKSDGKKLSTSVPPPRLDYRSMVSVDDMPELFASIDKLIPRPARSCDDPPLYLRLRMGRPKDRPVPRSTPLMSYGRKRMRPEYWFSVPRNRVDDLFKFINHWVPELYGELGDVTERGYILVDSDTELWDDEPGAPGEKGERSDSQGDMGDLTRESWEVLSMSDELRRALYSSGASVDLEFSPPDLIGVSEVLTMEHREKICVHLPARAQGYMWSLVFSSSVHGFSLNSMYRKMQRVDSPILLVVQDTDNNVFGAVTSCALRPSEHFYGTGESLLFSFSAILPKSPKRKSILPAQAPASPPPTPTAVSAPTSGDTGITTELVQQNITSSEPAEPPSPERGFRVWQWTGDNLYFIRGSNDNISIGAGDGKFGIWLDGDLYQGRTQSCTTYGNEPLSSQEDFIVKILECWAFI